MLTNQSIQDKTKKTALEYINKCSNQPEIVKQLEAIFARALEQNHNTGIRPFK